MTFEQIVTVLVIVGVGAALVALLINLYLIYCASAIWDCYTDDDWWPL